MKKLLARLNGAKDLTEGKPLKLILNFGLPLLFGMLFQQFYNMVDTVIVGKFLGKGALAAVGSTGSINFMILGFCMGICNGFAIPVAQTFGAKDFKNLKKYITNIVWASIGLAAIITVAVGIFTRDILVLMKTREDIIDQAYIYIFIIFMGIPVIFLYNSVAGILRSLGDSVTPVIFLIFSSLVNIVLDLILIKPMGVAGAAVATITSQALSGVICLIYMIKKYKYLGFEKDDWAFSTSHIGRLCLMGIPMGLQYSITAIGSVILQYSINGISTNAVAAAAAGIKVNMFICCPLDAMGSTMATYGGQNVGAKKMDRVDEGLKACTKLGIIYAIIAFAILALFGKYIALLFVSKKETELIKLIYLYQVCNASCYTLLAIVNIWRFMIQGLGFSVFAITAGICEMIARGLAGFFLVPKFGFICAAFASPLAWLFADMFLIPAYFYVTKKLKRQFRLI